MSRSKATVLTVWILAIIAAWELVAWSLVDLFHTHMATSKFPYLHDIVIKIISNSGTFLSEGAVTFTNAVIGCVLGTLVGVLLSIWMSAAIKIEQITYPYLILSQMIPVLGLAPIIYGIVRDEYASRILIATYITFFPVAINMLSAIKSVEKEKRELLYVYATNKWNMYLKLFLPASLPSLFGSLKVTAPLSVTAAILVELLGSQKGIGVIILRSLYYGSSQVINFWAAVTVSALLGIISYVLVVLLEYLCLPGRRVDIVER